MLVFCVGEIGNIVEFLHIKNWGGGVKLSAQPGYPSENKGLKINKVIYNER